MIGLSALHEIIDKKILGIHTIYLGKVIEVFTITRKAKIQPLTMVKRAASSPAQLQAITTAYLSRNAIHVPTFENEGGEMFRKLMEGDIVICGVCERDI